MKSLFVYTILVYLNLSGIINGITSPVKFDLSSGGCHLIEKFTPQFPNTIQSLQVSLWDQRYVFQPYAQGLNLYSTGNNGLDYNSRLSYIRAVVPAEHQFVQGQDEFNTTKKNNMELQFLFKVADEVTSQGIQDEGPDIYTYMGVSILFTSSVKNGTQNGYLPSGVDFINQFYPTGTVTSTSTIDINLQQAFNSLTQYQNQWLTYNGTNTTNLNVNVNWYVNSQIFYLDQSLIDKYTNQQVLSEEGDGIGFSKIKQQTLKPSNNTVATVTLSAAQVLRICYSGFEQTVLTQNYGLWLFVFVILMWWIICISTENNNPGAFMDQLNDNKWTQIPWYSVYKVNNDIFFPKLARYSNMLVIFSFQSMVMSILWAQFSNQQMYDVSDNIVLWYALVALLVSWPLGYFFGIFMYSVRESLKIKYQLQIQWKKITAKKSIEAINLSKAIDQEEDRIYTFYFFYYFLLLLTYLMTLGVTVWQNVFLQGYQQDLWVASIFICFFLDIFFDVFIALIPGLHNYTKYRGYFYDFEVGQLWKRVEEI